MSAEFSVVNRNNNNKVPTGFFKRDNTRNPFYVYIVPDISVDLIFYISLWNKLPERKKKNRVYKTVIQ